jgi:hypothetical protein
LEKSMKNFHTGLACGFCISMSLLVVDVPDNDLGS